MKEYVVCDANTIIKAVLEGLTRPGNDVDIDKTTITKNGDGHVNVSMKLSIDDDWDEFMDEEDGSPFDPITDKEKGE